MTQHSMIVSARGDWPFGRGLQPLLDALALDEVVLFGHSDGASIALLAAARGDLVLAAAAAFMMDQP